jgi:hypothetical protein
MNLSKTDFLRVFRREYRSPELVIHEIGESDSNPPYPLRPDAWFVRFRLDAFDEG